MPTEESKVFISYSREDAKFARRLGKDLKSKGLNIWLDKLYIKPGQNWDREVENALKTSGQFLIILSPSSVESDLTVNCDYGKITFGCNAYKFSCLTFI